LTLRVLEVKSLQSDHFEESAPVKSRACVLEQFGQPPVVREFETVPPAEGEVIVRILAAGVCGSDVHISSGEDPRTPLPIILGHEGCGRIEELSGDIRDIYGEALRPGDYVIWERGIFCRSCYYCEVAHRPYLCPNRKTYGISIGCAEPPYLQGCYAEHIHLRRGAAFIKLGESDDPAVIAAASCSGATAAHAVEEARIRPGDSVLVVGPGPLGLFAAAFAHFAGAGTIIMVGKSYHGLRLELAKEMGASRIVLSDEGSAEERVGLIRSLTDGLGANVVLDCAGRPAAMVEYVDCVAPGGRYVLPGIAVPVGEWPVKPFEQIARKNVSLQGLWVSDTGHLLSAVRLVQSGRYPFGKLITHRFGLEEADQGLKVMAERKAVKAALIP